MTAAAIRTSANNANSTSTTTSSSTLEAGQSAEITNAQGVTSSYVSDGGNAQVLTAVTGDFTATSNILEPLAAGQARTEPPAPPGIILKANSIGGAPTSTVNLLTDSKIFGYDPTTGQLIRFDLNLATNKGAIDPTFTPISVPGDPANAGVNIAQDGSQLVVLVSSGTSVYAFNANTGAAVGSFTTTAPINFIASTATTTVLGGYQTNQLQMINLPASLQTGTEQPLGSAQPFTPASEVTLLGGVTGVAGSNNLYATIAAHFSTLQPNQTQLGIQSIGTVQVFAGGGSTSVFNTFSSVLSHGTHRERQQHHRAVQPPDPESVVCTRLRGREPRAGYGGFQWDQHHQALCPDLAELPRDDRPGLFRSPGRAQPELPDGPHRLGTD